MAPSAADSCATAAAAAIWLAGTGDSRARLCGAPPVWTPLARAALAALAPQCGYNPLRQVLTCALATTAQKRDIEPQLRRPRCPSPSPCRPGGRQQQWRAAPCASPCWRRSRRATRPAARGSRVRRFVAYAPCRTRAARTVPAPNAPPPPRAGAAGVRTVRDVYELMYRDQKQHGGAYLLLNASGAVGSAGAPWAGRRKTRVVPMIDACAAGAPCNGEGPHPHPRVRACLRAPPAGPPSGADVDAPLIHARRLADAAGGGGGGGGPFAVVVPVAESSVFLQQLLVDGGLRQRVAAVLVDDTGAWSLGLGVGPRAGGNKFVHMACDVLAKAGRSAQCTHGRHGPISEWITPHLLPPPPHTHTSPRRAARLLGAPKVPRCRVRPLPGGQLRVEPPGLRRRAPALAGAGAAAGRADGGGRARAGRVQRGAGARSWVGGNQTPCSLPSASCLRDVGGLCESIDHCKRARRATAGEHTTRACACRCPPPATLTRRRALRQTRAGRLVATACGARCRRCHRVRSG